MQKDGRLWSIPVLDGFSFSQSTNTSEITLSEMEDSAGRSRRGMKMFTDSLSAAEWSFSTYTRPYLSAGGATATNGRSDDTASIHHAVEEALWAAMAGRNEYDKDTFSFDAGTSLGGALSDLAVSDFTVTGTYGSGGNGNYTLSINGTTDADMTLQKDGVVVASDPDAGTPYVLAGNTTYGGQGTGMRNAVISFTLTNGVISNPSVSERGTRFVTGDTVTIPGEMVGESDGEDISISFTSESFDADATDLDINFFDSNRAQIGTFTLYFLMNKGQAGRLIYALENAVVNEATIDFDVEGIATINWSGFAGQITELTKNGGTSLNVQGTEKTVDLQVQDAEPVTYKSDDATPLALDDLWIDSNDDDSFYVFAPAVGLAISTIVDNSSVTTVTTSTAHGLAVGNLFNITGATDYLETLAEVTAVNSSTEFEYATSGGSLTQDTTGTVTPVVWHHAIEEATTSTTNFIRNRLTQLTINADDTFNTSAGNVYKDLADGGYSIPLTGGSITITNNINYLTPEELGLVNQPIEHVTGTRSCTGSMTCYLGASDIATNRSKDLFNHLVNDRTSVVNEFELNFSVGGSDTTQPRVQFIIPRAHLEIPTHSVEDVISLEANFASQGSSIGEADEFTLKYFGV
jgi:hypothetical protein